MDFLLNRYRNITVLLVVLFGQLVLLAYQVKTNKDVPLIRVWAVSTVTPVEQALEFVRRNTIGVVEDYFVLIRVREQNEKLQRQMDQLKLENQFLKTQLSTADRARELSAFQSETPSKTLAARVIGNGTGANSKVVFIDRGSTTGVEAGMAVITPDGIVGKVVASYPTASLVMLVTDPSFAAGVTSQKNHVHGTLRGQGGPKCKVDFVQNEEKVDAGEWFYTSGDDRIFPRGFPVGQIASVKEGRSAKEIYVTPAGLQGGLEEVLVVIEGEHQPIPDVRVASKEQKLLPPPADAEAGNNPHAATAVLSTDADKLRQEYKQIGEQEKFTYGIASPKPPDFTKLGKPVAAPVKPGTPPGAVPGAPGATGATAAAGAGQPIQRKPPEAGGQATGQTTTTTAADKKPRTKPPALVPDQTDVDPASEALFERVQKEPAKPKVVAGDETTEILAPAPPPKKKAPPAEVQPTGAATPGASRPTTPPARKPPVTTVPPTGNGIQPRP